MRKFIIFTYSILLSTSTLAITLEEALESAYTHSQDIKSNMVKFQREIEEFPGALAEILPSVSAQIEYSDRKNKNISEVAPTNAINNKILQKSISLKQPLFKGGAGVAALKAAQANFHVSRSRFYANEQKVLLEVIQAYLDCFEAYESYNIYDVSVKSNQNQLESEEEKLRVGESTPSNVATAKAMFARAQTSKLNAIAKLEAAKANFLRIVGREADNIMAPPLPEGLPSTLEELQKKAISYNLDIEAAKYKIHSAKAKELGAKGALLPKVDFRIQAVENRFDTENALRGNINSQNYSSAISVEIPIFSNGGAEYTRVRVAKKDARLEVINLEDQIRRIKSNSIQVWQSYKTANSSILAATEGLEAAQFAYDGTVQEEIVGAKVIGDVLKAEEELNKSKVSKVTSIKEYILNAYTMKALTGQLTAKALRLKVHYFSPETEFKKTKMKIIGF